MLEYFDTDSEISQSGRPYRFFSETFLNLRYFILNRKRDIPTRKCPSQSNFHMFVILPLSQM